MNTQITKKDRRLLQILFIALVITLFARFLIYPIISDTIQVKDDIEVEKADKAENESKIHQLPTLKIMKSDLVTEATKQEERYFAYMQSDEIDQLLTDIVMKHNLEAMDLDIAMPIPAETTVPYVFSAIKQPEEEEIQNTEEDGEEPNSHGLYMTTVSMQVKGDTASLEKFIDTLTNQYESVQVAAYSWESAADQYITDQDGVNVLVTNKSKLLTVSLQIYMCEKEE